MIDVAIVGAAELEGEALLELMQERAFPVGELHLLADDDSIGQSLPFGARNLRIRAAASFDFSRVALVFIAGAGLGPAAREALLAASCDVVDMVGALGQQATSCLLPGINDATLAERCPPRRLRCPMPTSVALVTVLAPLARLQTLKRLVVTVCRPVSVRGRSGVKELARQTAELLNARPLEPRLFDRQVAFNLLAQTDEPDQLGHGAAERAFAEELTDLLGLPQLQVSSTFVQAPVFFGESLSVCALFDAPLDIAGAYAALDMVEGLELVDSPDYPTAVGDALGQDLVYVGRLRSGLRDASEVNLWIVSDNVRKGAALNAVLSGELLIKDYP